MRVRRIVLAVAVSLSPGVLAAQSFNLRDLLTDFLRNGITLAPPTQGLSHEAHFTGAESPQFAAIGSFTSELADQLSSFPIASSAGGFTYSFDPTLGAFTRTAESFGPIYAERAETIGKGKLNLGLNFSHFVFDEINGLSLRDGDVRLVFTHQDINHDGSSIQLFFEGDVITASVLLKLETDITAFVATYGVSDRLDIGAAVPIVRVKLEAQTNASIQRLATGTGSTVHRFLNGTSSDVFRQSGTASGVGDVVLRGKYRLWRNPRAGVAVVADLRLPTGQERDLLGTGAVQVKAFVIGSAHLGAFSPHLNAGYTWSGNASGGRVIPDEISYTGGFDWALGPRLTFAVDAIGRTFRNAEVVSVQDTTFEANTNSFPDTPPVIVRAVFPRLVSERKDSSTLIGSVGFKINPVGNLLLSVNGLFSLSDRGLQPKFAPLFGLDYSF